MKTVVLGDVARNAWMQARRNLSTAWRRDADLVRKRTLKAEKRAAAAVADGWHRMKPKVVQVEHRMHDGLLAALHRIRPHA